MQKRLRLTKRRDFAAVRSQGRSSSNKFLVLRVAYNDLDTCRIGFAVSKSVGNAVVRNLVKRRMREATRLSNLVGGKDAIFIARRSAAAASFWEIKGAIEDLLRRAKLLLEVHHTVRY